MNRQLTANDVYTTITKSSQDVIMGLDLNGIIVTWNKAAENLYGYKLKEVLSLSINCLIPAHKICEMEQILKNIKDSKKKWHFNTVHLKKNKGKIEVSVSMLPIIKKSTLIGIALVIKEVKASTSEHEMFRLAIESSSSGMLVVNKNGDIELVNNQSLKMFHYKKEDLIGQKIEILVPERFRENHPKYRMDFFRDPKTRALGSGRDLWGLRSDGIEFPIEIGLNPLKTESEMCVLVSIIDITQRKFYEERIKKSNEDLESFAHVVSHDLKAPLRGISIVSQWLREECYQEIDSKGKEYLDLIESRVVKMQALIDGILDYSKIGYAQKKPELIHLNELIAEIVEILMLPKHIKIQIPSDMPVLYAIKTHMHQIFQNLVSNAVKYNDKNQGIIEIECSHDSKKWKFVIKDNGMGIRRQDKEKIFELFQTGESNGVDSSTGVGLSLVKKIVELYGGKIWYKSKVGQETSFYFTLKKEKVNGTLPNFSHSDTN